MLKDNLSSLGPLSLSQNTRIKINAPDKFYHGAVAVLRRWLPYTKGYSARLVTPYEGILGGVVFAKPEEVIVE